MELCKKIGISEEFYKLIVDKIGRKPNDTELFLFSAMWSEHCGYMYSKKLLATLPKEKAFGTEENAGGIRIGNSVIVFKVESHNHPCAVEPYQGAATGIGGILRDIMAVGARPIALLDSLKFGNLTDKKARKLFNGVVSGISDYGNSTGVPTIGGETIFDEEFSDNPLVNVMAVGEVKIDAFVSAKGYSGLNILLIGSYTGRDGINGASFASKTLSQDTKTDLLSVQIGDPFMKKCLIEACLEIFGEKLAVACQDCGAAGILSSTSEISYKSNCGVELNLDRVHLREKDMRVEEIMLSESQERMVLLVKDKDLDKTISILYKYDIPYSNIGKTTNDKRYRLLWNGAVSADLPYNALADAPVMDLKFKEYTKDTKSISTKSTIGTRDAVIKMIQNPNIASKKWVFMQYDHTVRGKTAKKPYEAQSGVIKLNNEEGFVGFTIDTKPLMTYLNPYAGCTNTIMESYRNLVASGLEPMGVTNCLNFGNPNKSDAAYQFYHSVQGLKYACETLDIPVVSGNVSFYNETKHGEILPSPTISMMGYTKSAKSLINSVFKENETIYLLGNNIEDITDTSGSLYERILFNYIGGTPLQANIEEEIKLKEIIFSLKNNNLINSCIDISEGGLFAALLEGLRVNNLGFRGNLIFCKDELKALFGESCGQYIFATDNPQKTEKFFEKSKVPYKKLGICGGKSILFDSYEFVAEELFKLYDNAVSDLMAGI